MDVAPPQAPPALTRSAQQDGIDAVGRLVAARDWLRAQQNLMPSPDGITSQDAFDAYSHTVDRYWQTQVTYDGNTLSRKDALARLMAGMAGDLAALMAQDGSLDESAAATIRAMTTAHGDAMPERVHANELTLRDKPLASTLILLAEDRPDQLLVFTPESGWRVMRDLYALYRDTEQRARLTLTRRVDLPGMNRLDAYLAMSDFTAGLKPLSSHPWQALADRVVALQKEKLAQAWFESQIAPDDPSRATYLADRLRDAVRLDDAIDIDAMLTMRDNRLYLAAQTERLAHVPVAMRRDWLAAASGYLSAHRAARGIFADHGMSAPLDVDTFASQDPWDRLLPERYDAYLEGLRSGEGSRLRRDLTTGVQHALIRMRAEDARLAYVLTNEPQAFRDDHAQRGYQWVKAVLDSPSPIGRAKVEGHEIVASQVVIGGLPIEGVFAIGARQPRSVSTILVYTPDAPDGKHFHEFDDWQDAITRFFHQPTFHAYLSERLPGLVGDIAGSAPTLREVTGNLLDLAYDAAIDTGRRAASHGDTHLPTMLTAPFKDTTPVWRTAEDASTSGRSKRDVLGWMLRPFRKRPRGPAGGYTALPLWTTPVARYRAAAGTTQAFETDFLARGVRKIGESDGRGLYKVDGRTYIAEGDTLYGARYDSQIGTMRLQRPGASATSYGPAIRRLGGDHWTYDAIGLLGGGDRSGGLPRIRPSAPNSPIDGRGARYFQRFMAELEDAIPNPVDRQLAINDMHARLTAPGHVSTLAAEHRLRVDFALNRAARIHPPRPLTEAGPAPTGYRTLTADEVPEVVFTPWRDEAHLVHIRTYGGMPSTYLRMEPTMLSATHQGVAMRATISPPTPAQVATPTYALRIRLRHAYSQSVQPEQARFDVYRSLTDPDDLVVRPRGDMPLTLTNSEYEVALSPMPDFPNIHQLLAE